ncbi:molybdopterin-dependent oxidoreductase [Loktanella sp. TSTF-M6]|uniref:Molybdopterin-dependent oxidoreductase n=1 Tax=Loktanella gaetbuli TaxID=2881335 RepID=A0ABS8BV31_9RHOB|nr:molybdopterin-dependent oxidoreductase [Loktanella gaetbuli]MCB5199595.1 molybdopterin-dependent oxidoreductase [Loktanella gaetbuli]
MIKFLRTIAGASAILILSATPLLAQDIPAPQGDVLLTITGNIQMTNVDDQLQLDRDALMALEAATFETSTIWTEGVHSFQGVSLATLMEALGVTEGTIIATAINDYAVEIPVSDAVEGGGMVAYLMDDAEMRVRDKGPLWVVYPYDSDPAYRTEVIYSRSIWQLDRLEVVN